jgi:hypothetical protein
MKLFVAIYIAAISSGAFVAGAPSRKRSEHKKHHSKIPASFDRVQFVGKGEEHQDIVGRQRNLQTEGVSIPTETSEMSMPETELSLSQGPTGGPTSQTPTFGPTTQIPTFNPTTPIPTWSPTMSNEPTPSPVESGSDASGVQKVTLLLLGAAGIWLNMMI